MIEDQVAPKRCGHTPGKQVVSRSEALQRIRAAVDAREEGVDILILARTDARATHGLAEALWRARAFVDCGADIVFLEALRSAGEMEICCQEVPGPKLANMLEQGQTPILPPNQLADIGYQIAAYPLTLLNVSVKAMQDALLALGQGTQPQGLLPFADLQAVVGFPEYYQEEKRYAATKRARRANEQG